MRVAFVSSVGRAVDCRNLKKKLIACDLSIKMDVAGTKEKAGEAICNDIRHENPYTFDCKFMVGADENKTETVYGCRYLFAIESPVFESMLFGDFKEAKQLKDGIPLPEDDPQTLRHFRLLSTYGSDRASRLAALNLDELLKLIQFSHKYSALTIFKLCSDRIIAISENASVTDLFQMFAALHNFPEEEAARAKVIAKIKSKGNIQYPVIKMDLDAFLDLYDVIRSFKIKTCFDIFNFIDAYVKRNDSFSINLLSNDDEKASNEEIDEKDGETLKKEIFKRLLKELDWSTMPIENFFRGPSESNILTIEQKYLILSGLNQRKTPIKITF